MSKAPEDLTGRKFGKLLVLRQDGFISRNTAWICVCDCGNTQRVRGTRMVIGEKTHCGCVKPEPRPLKYNIRRELIEELSIPEPNSGCWLWLGPWNPRTTYGTIAQAGVSNLAHRLSYLFFKGDPAGLFVCHRCDNPTCVNPDHLFLGTAADNTNDMVSKMRHVHGSGHTLSKLTDADVLAIRDDARSSRLVAAQYGVCGSTIRKVRRGEGWAHVPQRVVS